MSMRKNTRGGTTSANVQFPIARMPRILESTKMTHVSTSSFSGFSQADTYVGQAAIMSESELNAIPRFDSPKYCHNKMATPDKEMHTLSRVLHPFSPWIMERMKMVVAPRHAAAMSPLMVPFAIMPDRMIQSPAAQTSQVAFLGFAAPARIARMNGTNATRITTPERTDRMLLNVT